MKKTNLRKRYKSLRCAFAGMHRADASKKIAGTFIKYVYPLLPGLRGAACYYSTKNEAPAGGIISFLRKKNISVYLPAVTAPGKIEFRLYEKRSRLKKGAYSIFEPSAKCRKASARDFQVIIVPGAAFDRLGGRLGMGGGYYDRFLAKLPKRVLKAGLAYSCQIARKVPSQKHDIGMDVIITEKGFIDARKKNLRQGNL